MGGIIQDNILQTGKDLYSQKAYSDALAFFLSLPSESVIDKVEVSYYLGLCYTKLKKYDDALLFLGCHDNGLKLYIRLILVF